MCQIISNREHGKYLKQNNTQNLSSPSSETQGQIVGARERLNGRKITFLRAIFFRPFSLSLAPTICPWVSEDVSSLDHKKNSKSNKQLIEITTQGPVVRRPISA